MTSFPERVREQKCSNRLLLSTDRLAFPIDFSSLYDLAYIYKPAGKLALIPTHAVHNLFNSPLPSNRGQNFKGDLNCGSRQMSYSGFGWEFFLFWLILFFVFWGVFFFSPHTVE